MAPTFLRAPKFGAMWLPFGARSFSMAEIWRCLPWEKLRFCPLHFASHHIVGLRGNGFLNGFSKYFCSYLKTKVIYVTLFQVLGEASIAEHILNWWNVLCNVSRRGLKNMQKLRQKILEDHLRQTPSNCFDKQTKPTNHKTIHHYAQMISTLGHEP